MIGDFASGAAGAMPLTSLFAAVQRGKGRRAAAQFIYQETKSDGTQSNFFRLENPQREDA
jgi:hypothetical protein